VTNPNSFLQSPFDAIAKQDEDDGTLPGQQAVKAAPKLDMPKAAPAADAPDQPEPAATRRAAKTTSYLPPDDLVPLFESAAQKYDVPANVIMALAHQESRYNSKAIGEETQWGRAKGMLQYLDDTAKGLGINQFDAAQSIDGAAKQIRQRLDQGASMIDAVKEHFAGPDRKKWGAKTEAYGREVMEKVGKIGDLMMGSAHAGEQSAAAATDIPKDWVKLTPEQAAEYEAKSASSTVPNPLAPDAKPETSFLDEYVLNPLKRGAQSMKQGFQASGAMYDARQLAAIGKIDKGEKVPDQDDALGYQYMNPAQRAEIKKTMGEAFTVAVKDTTETGKKIAAIPQDPIVAAASNAKSFDEWWKYFKQAPIKFIAQTSMESLPNMVPGLVLGAGTGLAAQATMKAGGVVAGAAGMGAGSYAVDYPSSVMSALQDMGIDTNNPDALAKAFSDPKVMKDVQQKAHAHASVVGALDAVSGGRAGATIVGGKTIAKQAANLGAKTVEQGVLGAAGEAGGQVAQGKKELEWGAIMGEFAGEMAGAPVEIAGAAKLKAQEALAARGADPAAAPAAEPAATAAPAPMAAPSAPASTPSQEAGPLSRSAENAAEQHAGQPQRVVVETPQGAGAGTLSGYQEDADGNFVAQIQGDDGQVHQVTSADGVKITPEAPADSGPLTASLSAAADAHEASPAPVPERPAAAPAEPDYSTMPIEELRGRMKYIAEQAKASGGWNKRFIDERKKVEREINAKTAGAQADSKLAEEPLSAGPFDDMKAANKMALRSAESTGQPHEVVEVKGKFKVQPIKETSDAGVPVNVREPGDGRGGSDRDAAVAGTAVGDGPVPARDAGGRPGNAGKPARKAQQHDTTGDAGAGKPADAKPALAEAAQPEWEKNPYTPYKFADRERADAFMVKKQVDPAKFEVVQTGKVRWEVKPKADGTVAEKSNLDAAREKHAKQDEAVRVAAENIARRKAEKEAAAKPIERHDVEIIKETGSSSADINKTMAGLPPVADGHVRLYRAESPTTKFDDVFNADGLGDFKTDQPGERYTPDLKYADYYRQPYGRDAKIHYIDVPQAVADKVKLNDAEYVVDTKIVPAAKKVPDVAPVEAAVDTQVKPKKKAPARGKAADAARTQALADHFTPGNVVKGYGGHDRVLAYTPPDGDGNFSVKVQHVVRKGDAWVVALGTDGRERTHSTMPNERELKAGPVESAPKATGNPMIDNPASWVIREKKTGKVVMETFDRKKVDALNTKKYEAVSIAEHLGSLNQKPAAEQDNTPVPEATVKYSVAGDDQQPDVKQFREAMVEKYPGIRLELFDRGNGDLNLSLVIVPKDERSTGTGTALMNDLTAYADATGKRIVLTPSGDFGGNKARLRKFYKRFGFVENKGRAKDFSIMDAMYRDPEGGKPVLYSVSDDSAATAIADLMAAKEGEAVINRPDVGDITVAYGDAKAGLAHIARRRGAGFMARLPALLRDGSVYEKPGQTGRIFIGTDKDEAVIRLDRDGETKNWLLSAYEKYPDLAPASAKQSSVGQQQAADFKVMSPDEVKAAITTGTIGPVIARLIEHGAIVIHKSVKTLPKEAGKVAKGVQAVTMPDGTIHFVAGSLTNKNARAVLLHEAFHKGAESLIGSKEWANLMGRAGSLYRQSEQSSGRAREFFDRARARVASAKAKGAVTTRMEVEEFAAYAIEEYETARDGMPAAVRKWVDDLIGLVKAWMVKRYGKQVGQVTPAQLSAFAKLAIMDVAAGKRGEMFGPIGELFSMAGSITDTPAFQRWFGMSKVVDDNGAPLVVYHGTDADITEFRTKDNDGQGKEFPLDGAFFAEHPDAANEFGSHKKGTNVIHAYLSLRNPLEREMRDDGEGIDADWRNPMAEQDVITEARTAGNDGVIFRSSLTGERYFVVFAPEQIKSATGNAGTFSPDNPDIRYSVVADVDAPANEDATAEQQGLTPPEQGLLRRVQAAIQDNMNRVKQVQERILEATGRATLGKSDYYGAETNRPGRIAARLEDGEDFLFKPLMQRLAKAGHTQAQLSELLHAMHAHERNERVAAINPEMPDGGSGMTDAQANEILARYEGDGFKSLHRLADAAREIAKATLDLKLAYGLIKSADHEMLSTMYEHYVPLKGDGEYGPKIKRAMGHEERDEHILDNIARDYDQAVVVGEKNLARQSLLQMVLQFKDDALWTARVPPKGRYVAGQVLNVMKDGQQVASFTSKPQVSAFLEGLGSAAVGHTVQTSAGEQVTEFTKPLQDNEVMVYVKGDPVRIQIHDETLARQLRPLNQGQMNPVLEFMRTVNQYLSKIYTGYNPAFILRNTARDAMTGTINMLGNQGAGIAAKAWMQYPSALKTMGQWAATKKVPDGQTGNYLTEYRMHGGKVGASWMSDLEQKGKTLEVLFDDAYGAAGYARDGKVGKAARVAGRKIVGGLAHVIEIGNQATENALRLALFIALRKDGMSPALAAQAAKGVTVDFDRKGAQTGALGAIYLFFNPAVQGTANAVKTLAKGRHRQQAWAALGGLALLGVYAASKGMGDDKDRWLGEGWETRTKNFMMNVGWHQLRVPISQEFAPVYALGVALAEGLHGETKAKTAARVVSSFIDAYFPLQGAFKADSDNHLLDAALATVPTVFKPLSESAANRNSFGSQIVPENELTKDRPDNLKMFRGTKNSMYDKAAQGMAAAGVMAGFAGQYENDITKVSPETLKSLWRTYTGGLGQFVTDSVGLASMTVADPSQVEVGDVPIVKDFVHDQDVKPIRGRYYDLAREAHAAITEFEQAKKAGDGDALDAIFKDDAKARLVGLGRMVRSTNKAAAAVRDEAVDVNADKQMAPAAKRAALKKIEQTEEELYRAAIEAFK
jgi:hypothetical protein